jgi:hypothetical protein
MTQVLDPGVLAAGVSWLKGWKWTGNFTTLDLIAVGTNALNGALLARRPDHYKNYTVVGILLMALLMGLGGGMTRDVLINQVPAALTNPAHITVCVIAGIIGYNLAVRQGPAVPRGAVPVRDVLLPAAPCRCMRSSGRKRASPSGCPWSASWPWQ